MPPTTRGGLEAAAVTAEEASAAEAPLLSARTPRALIDGTARFPLFFGILRVCTVEKSRKFAQKFGTGIAPKVASWWWRGHPGGGGGGVGRRCGVGRRRWRGPWEGREPKLASYRCGGPLRTGVEQTVKCALFFNCAHYGAGSSSGSRYTVTTLLERRIGFITQTHTLLACS